MSTENFETQNETVRKRGGKRATEHPGQVRKTGVMRFRKGSGYLTVFDRGTDRAYRWVKKDASRIAYMRAQGFVLESGASGGNAHGGHNDQSGLRSLTLNINDPNDKGDVILMSTDRENIEEWRKDRDAYNARAMRGLGNQLQRDLSRSGAPVRNTGKDIAFDYEIAV